MASRRTVAVRTPTGAFVAGLVWLVAAANLVAIVWLWYHGGNVVGVEKTGDVLTSAARLTGLLGSYSALLQVLLLARIPWLERQVGLDRLSVWHRWNGHACLYLVLAHVVLSIWGYALLDKLPLTKEISTMLNGGIYPGMITATIGTVLLLAVVFSSIVIVRRRMRYEWWYAVHITVYASIALAWFPRSRPATSSCSTAPQPTTGARCTSRRWRCSCGSVSASRPSPRCASGCTSRTSSR